jgi:uncharacterized protein DUF6812
MDTRIQRVVLETARFRIVGNVTLPTEGFRTRLSDVLNRQDTGYIPLVDVELTPPDGGEVQKLPFVAVSRNRIEVAYEIDGPETVGGEG